MKINAYKSLSISLLVALPFLGGVNECEGPPEPEPEPELCFSDGECGAGEYCNTDLCLSPCAEDEICPAVCYGACEPLPEPDLCFSDADCGALEHCNTDLCMAPPCDGEAHLTVCYGICEPEPPACEPVLCDIACDRLARDERGCEICACEEPPPPPPVCEDVVCALYCEGGFRTDERGCPICECEPPPPPACEPVLCDLYCEHGFITDERGCEICACNPPPTDRSCGGFAGFACGPDEWCDYDADVPACGAADHLGTCRPRPDACIELYAPVCGCDGASYDNECFAHAAGVDTWAGGTCAPPEPGR